MSKRQDVRRHDRGVSAALLASLDRWVPARPAERIAYAGLARSENSASQEDGPGLDPLPPTARGKHEGPSSIRDGGMSLPARAWIIVGAAALLWTAAALGIALLF